MLANGTAGQVFPPPLVGGKTPGEIEEWFRSLVGAEAYQALLEDHGADAVLGAAIACFSRDRLLDLLSGESAPQDEEERALVEAAGGGRPISLLPVGLEDWDADGVSPVLRKVLPGGGWVFALGDFTSEVFDDVVLAARQCQVFADALTT
jgi:hypothetical protein